MLDVGPAVLEVLLARVVLAGVVLSSGVLAGGVLAGGVLAGATVAGALPEELLEAVSETSPAATNVVNVRNLTAQPAPVPLARR